jgi:hypothetical protein
MLILVGANNGSGERTTAGREADRVRPGDRDARARQADPRAVRSSTGRWPADRDAAGPQQQAIAKGPGRHRRAAPGARSLTDGRCRRHQATSRTGDRPCEGSGLAARVGSRYADKLRARRHAARLTSARIRKAIAARPAATGHPRRAGSPRSDQAASASGASAEAVHLHHRKLRRHGDHRIVNALHVCTTATTRSTTRAQLVLHARLPGQAHRDPADVAVRFDDVTPTFLTLTGTYREAA